MDMLTTAADAILSENSVSIVPLTPTKNSRNVFGDISNLPVLQLGPSSKINAGSSLNALFKEKITTNVKSKIKTPGKRRKNASKYGDENEAPSPKTPRSGVKSERYSCKKQESPITPMSNLKLLTRIASMEEHMPSKKSLFKNPVETKTTFRRCYSDNIYAKASKDVVSSKLKKYPTICDTDSVNNIPRITKVTQLVQNLEGTRREKSLGLLCERFLEHFPIEVSCLETPRRLVIDDVAATLGTERRRVYDIVNILECLNMASRVQKNMYQWMGKLHLEMTLSRLKSLALKCGFVAKASTPFDQVIKETKSFGDSSDKYELRKEKSLGVLCQKFLMLFLTSSPPHVLSLDTALYLLLGREGEDLDKLRTRGRRIYDIANVLISLQLMKKVPQTKSFMYIGPFVEASQFNEDFFENQIKLRHSLLPPLNGSPAFQSPGGDAQFCVITPSDNLVPVEKKGKPRKLAKEFIISTGNRRPLSRAESENLGKMNESDRIIKPPSLNDICKVTEVEREMMLKRHQSAGNFTSQIRPTNSVTFIQQPPRPSHFLHFPRLGTPRMALTFQNLHKSPPALTNKPPVLRLPQVQVMTYPRAYFQKLNVITNKNHGTRAAYIVHRPVQPITSGSGFNSNGVFKVYSKQIRHGKSHSSPSVVNPEPSMAKKPLSKSYSQVAFPSISFNTLAKSHYKTVIGGGTDIPSSNGGYRFVINTNKNSGQASPRGNRVETETKSFIKIFHTSPDSSSTDSELENIFGDSFKFTHPDTVVNKVEHV